MPHFNLEFSAIAVIRNNTLWFQTSPHHHQEPKQFNNVFKKRLFFDFC